MLLTQNIFSDNDELRETIKGWDLDFKQIDNGDFKFTLKQSANENYNLLLADCNRVLDQKGASPKNMKTFALLSKDSSEVFWLGKDFLPGDLALYPDSQELDAFSKSGFKVFVISLKEEIFENTVETLKISNEDIFSGKHNIFRLNNLNYQLLNDVFNSSLNGYDYNLNSLGKNYFAELLLDVISGNDNKKTDKYNLRLKAINEVREQLHSEPQKNYTIHDLCLLTGVSKRTLQYAFLEFCSVPPLTYIRNYKLNIAYNLIKNTDQNISEIAFSLGFKHLGYFSFYFKRVFGQSPIQIKKLR